MASVAFLQPAAAAAAAPAALGARDARGVLRGWEAPGDGRRGTEVSSWMVGTLVRGVESSGKLGKQVKDGKRIYNVIYK